MGVKHQFQIYAPVDYIAGYLRYGHYEGDLELTKEELEQIKENPSLLENYDLKLIVDDYRIEDVGNISEVRITEYL